MICFTLGASDGLNPKSCSQALGARFHLGVVGLRPNYPKDPPKGGGLGLQAAGTSPTTASIAPCGSPCERLGPSLAQKRQIK